MTDIEKVQQEFKAYKEFMEVRLSETMAEAKRHYESFKDMRTQYNSYVEGRINKMATFLVEKAPLDQQKQMRSTEF